MPRPGYVDHIAVSATTLDGNEWANLLQVVRSTRLSSGEFVARFERNWADYIGVEDCVTCSSGTTALHLALLALGVKPGDEVLIPTLTFIATANAVTYCGATPVFIDSDPHTWNIDPAKLGAAITPRTVGIIAVHLYGQPCDMDALRAIADQHGLWMVEDAAQAHGATYQGQRVGSLSDAATWSFYGNKTLSMGEGGAVTTNRPDLAATMRLLRGQGMDPVRRYVHPVVGYNYRLTDLQAAVGVAQLERIDALLDKRRYLRLRYHELLGTRRDLDFQGRLPNTVKTPWLETVILADHLDRDALTLFMAERGVETRPVFVPCHQQAPYAKGASLPVSERLARQGVSLPTHAAMDTIHVEQVCEALVEAIEAQTKGGHDERAHD